MFGVEGREWVAIVIICWAAGEGGRFFGGEEEAGAFCAWWCGAGRDREDLTSVVECLEDVRRSGILAGEGGC